MLSEEAKARIEAEAALYPSRRSALSEALMAAQAERGWLSDEALAEVARELGLSAASAESVATFYELVMRRRVGPHVILVCDSVSCWIRGGESLLDRLKKRLGVELGGTSADGLFTLLPAGCLGLCERAPALMIDGRVYGDLTGEGLDALIDEIKEASRGDAAVR
jgi:NADH-quinone oxidoreductase subunit E